MQPFFHQYLLTMAFYVKKHPDNCDPREPCYLRDHKSLPYPQPWRWWIRPGPDPGIPVWRYSGLFSFQQDFPLPEILLVSDVAGDTPRFGSWSGGQLITFPDGFDHQVDAVLVINSGATADDADTFALQITLDGSLMFRRFVGGQEIPMFESTPNPDDYAHLVQAGGDQFSLPGSEPPDHLIDPPDLWPTAWDRSRPGPPALGI